MKMKNKMTSNEFCDYLLGVAEHEQVLNYRALSPFYLSCSPIDDSKVRLSVYHGLYSLQSEIFEISQMDNKKDLFQSITYFVYDFDKDRKDFEKKIEQEKIEEEIIEQKQTPNYHR